MWVLGEVIEAIKGVRPVNLNQVITGIVARVEETFPGALFVAQPGNHNQTEQVNEAFKRGAICALVQQTVPAPMNVLDLETEQPIEKVAASLNFPLCLRVSDIMNVLKQMTRYWQRKTQLRIIALIDCNKGCILQQLVADILMQRYRTKTQGKRNTIVDTALALLNINEAIERMVINFAFDEVELFKDVVVPQTVVMMHLRGLSGEHAPINIPTRPQPAILVQRLPLASDGVVILNFDEPYLRELANHIRVKKFLYGLDPQADLWADGIEGLGMEGIRLRLHYGNEIVHVRIPLFGYRSVHTVLCAASVGIHEGLTWQEIVKGLNVEQAQLRLLTTHASNGAILLDDTYEASIESTLASLNLLEGLEGCKIVVLGDRIEPITQQKIVREMVGIRAAEVADKLVVIGKQAQQIASAAWKAGLDAKMIVTLEEVQQAIDWLRANTGPEDIILVKGSREMGMEAIVPALEAGS